MIRIYINNLQKLFIIFNFTFRPFEHDKIDPCIRIDRAFRQNLHRE
jgi:hypothetical protein